MGIPKRAFEKARINDTKLSLSNFNRAMDTLTRLDAAVPDGPGVAMGGFNAGLGEAGAVIRLVEMNDQPEGNIGPASAESFISRSGTVLYWNAPTQTFEKTDPPHTITIVTDPYGGHVVHAGQRLLVYYHRQSGFHLPFSPPQVRHVQTIADPENGYPAAGSGANAFPFVHLKSSFSEAGGFVRTASHVTLQDDGSGSDYGVHGYVYNLMESCEGSYIPQGTVVPAWFLNEQWWTNWVDANCEPYESESSSGSGSPESECITTIDGRLFDEIPIETDMTQLEYVLGVDVDGCLKRVPIQRCGC